MTRAAFTEEERAALIQHLITLAKDDPRIPACAEVGSVAGGRGDRWSDVDLTFAVGEGASVAQVLADWTGRLEREHGAVPLFDLPFRTSIYRVFLFPGHLQVDLSFTPAADFGALGPDFRLRFGAARERAGTPAPDPWYQLGLAVHHALRARIAIERGRLWQAEHWVSAVRDEVITLACLGRGLESRYARGADRLDEVLRERLEAALVRALDRAELLRALRVAIECLVAESRDAQPLAARVESALRDLMAPEWPGT